MHGKMSHSPAQAGEGWWAGGCFVLVGDFWVFGCIFHFCLFIDFSRSEKWICAV